MNVQASEQIFVREHSTCTQCENLTFIIDHNLRNSICTLQTLMHVWEHSTCLKLQEKLLFKIKQVVTLAAADMQVLAEEFNIRRLQVQQQDICLNQLLSYAIKSNDQVVKGTNSVVFGDFSKASKLYSIQQYWQDIFIQLLENALTFRSTERRPIICFQSYTLGKYFVLECMDNGLGLDTVAHKSKIFGFRSTFHDGLSSNGLGLYLVKAKVESMRGIIEAHGKEQGLMIRISIPTL